VRVSVHEMVCVRAACVWCIAEMVRVRAAYVCRVAEMLRVRAAYVCRVAEMLRVRAAYVCHVAEMLRVRAAYVCRVAEMLRVRAAYVCCVCALLLLLLFELVQVAVLKHSLSARGLGSCCLETWGSCGAGGGCPEVECSVRMVQLRRSTRRGPS
jgi:hypothetical protein